MISRRGRERRVEEGREKRGQERGRSESSEERKDGSKKKKREERRRGKGRKMGKGEGVPLPHTPTLRICLTLRPRQIMVTSNSLRDSWCGLMVHTGGTHKEGRRVRRERERGRERRKS